MGQRKVVCSCGSTVFLYTVYSQDKASIDENNNIEILSTETCPFQDITAIFCDECGEELDFQIYSNPEKFDFSKIVVDDTR